VTDELPPELQRAIDDAKATLAGDPEARVPLPERGAIWHALGDVGALGGPGHRRRARLAELAVEKVEPFWRETYPGDDTVRRMLEAARGAVAGEGDEQALDAWIDDFWDEIAERTTDEPRFRASYVGRGACAALRTATEDEAYGYPDEGRDDHDLDIEAWDASWWSALAYGGGTTGEAAYRPERRREFWEWYLDEAVPAAWRSA
jgi:hypothetical protein